MVDLSKEYFSKHKAFYQKTDNGERLEWREPGTQIGYIKYIVDGFYLYVSGDLGDAIYKWNEAVNLQWISGCNMYYFESKCVASECEVNYKEWKPKLALAAFQCYYPDCVSMLPEAKEAAENYYTFSEFLFNELNDYDLSDSGYTIALRCRLHLRGLKDAMKSLNKEE